MRSTPGRTERIAGECCPEVCEELYEFYSLLREHFGYTPRWWPGTPWEITLTAVLVQQCNWTAAHQAVGRLRKQGLLELRQLASSDPESVRSCIHPVSFAPTKSKRLIGLARSVLERGFEEIEAYLRSSSTGDLRRDLLSFEGIGEETADCILLYASDRNPAFVIDSYTRRVFRRTRVLANRQESFWKKPYGHLRQFFEAHLSASLSRYDVFPFAAGVARQVALFRDFHAQIVELAKHHCLKTSPRCRSRGTNGWDKAAFCEAHCRQNECVSCPLAHRCRWSLHGRHFV